VKLSEAFVKSLADQQLAVSAVIKGQDAIWLPFMGPRIDRGIDLAGIRVDVDLNVFYHVYCDDPATMRAYHALRKADADHAAVLEAFDLSWCPENDHLQAQGLQTVAAAARMAWRMVEAAAALQGAAYAFTDWTPDTAEERRAIRAAFHGR